MVTLGVSGSMSLHDSREQVAISYYTERGVLRRPVLRGTRVRVFMSGYERAVKSRVLKLRRKYERVAP